MATRSELVDSHRPMATESCLVQFPADELDCQIMHEVLIENMGSWATLSAGRSFAYPMAVYEICPYCARRHSFSLENLVNINQLEHEIPTKVLCPGCRKLVRFYIIDAGNQTGDDWTGELWMHPSASGLRARPVDDLLPPRLVADYHDAIESYQHGLWRAAAQQARVVLEGVVKTLLSQSEDTPVRSRTSLAELLSRLAQVVDLAKPINDVSEVLKDGGNLASHFDNARDVTSEMASEMLDLLGAFLDYLLLTPRAVARLRLRLEEEAGHT